MMKMIVSTYTCTREDSATIRAELSRLKNEGIGQLCTALEIRSKDYFLGWWGVTLVTGHLTVLRRSVLEDSISNVK